MNPNEQYVKKSLLVKIGIIIIVAFIFFLWLASLKGVFENQKTTTDVTWQKISSDMDKSFQDAQNRFDEAANIAASTTDSTFVNGLLDKASSTATSTVATSTAAAELKQEFTDITNSKKVSCPQYINCMPSIGEARPCVIPPGCEKITQIAY